MCWFMSEKVRKLHLKQFGLLEGFWRGGLRIKKSSFFLSQSFTGIYLTTSLVPLYSETGTCWWLKEWFPLEFRGRFVKCFCRCAIIWLSCHKLVCGWCSEVKSGKNLYHVRAHSTTVPFCGDGLGCACIATTAQHWPCQPCSLGEPFVLSLFTLVTTVEHSGKIFFVLHGLIKLLL